jgi:hypothetical protein
MHLSPSTPGDLPALATSLGETTPNELGLLPGDGRTGKFPFSLLRPSTVDRRISDEAEFERDDVRTRQRYPELPEKRGLPSAPSPRHRALRLRPSGRGSARAPAKTPDLAGRHGERRRSLRRGRCDRSRHDTNARRPGDPGNRVPRAPMKADEGSRAPGAVAACSTAPDLGSLSEPARGVVRRQSLGQALRARKARRRIVTPWKSTD